MSNLTNTFTQSHEILDESKITFVQLCILILCFFVFLLEGFDILIIAYAAPSITQAWGVSSQQMGLVFSGGLLGMTLGAVFLGPLADIYGRRIVVTIALLVAGIATSAVIYTTDVYELVVARIIAGLAIGALVVALPPLVGELSPAKYRTVILSILFAGSALGSVTGGLVAAAVIATHGWTSIFLYAGLITLALGVLLFATVPETPSFTIKRKSHGTFENSALEKVNKTLRYLGQKEVSQLPTIAEKESASITSLFVPARRKTTRLLWASFFFGYIAVYFLASWVPQILSSLGMPHEQAIRSGVIIPVGGMIGTSLIGLLGRWWPLNSVITLTFTVGGVLTIIFAGLLHALPPASSTFMIWGMLFIIGATLMGGFSNLYTVALSVYPSQIRSTGLGWAAGIGRAGAVLSPALAGFMIALGVSRPALFIYFAIPIFVAASCVYFLKMKELT